VSSRHPDEVVWNLTHGALATRTLGIVFHEALIEAVPA